MGIRWAGIVGGLAMSTGLCMPTVQAEPNVDLVWAQRPQSVVPGIAFEISLFAQSVRADGLEQRVGAMDVVLTWDPAFVELVGINDVGPYEWFQSGFLNDALNDSLSDGDAKYTALAQFGASSAAVATPEGLLVTNFRFAALAEGDLNSIVIEASLGQGADTRVFGVDYPGHIVTGALGEALVTIAPRDDCDGDGDFDLAEFQRLQSCYTDSVIGADLGAPVAYPEWPEMCCANLDYDDDGDVDGLDVSVFESLMAGPTQ